MKPTRIMSYFAASIFSSPFDLAVSPGCQAADPKDKGGLAVNDLSMEVAALQTFASPGDHAGGRGRRSANWRPKRVRKPKSGRKARQATKSASSHADLRDALLNGNEGRIEEVEEQLADLLDEEETDLDDCVAITAAATLLCGSKCSSRSGSRRSRPCLPRNPPTTCRSPQTRCSAF